MRQRLMNLMPLRVVDWLRIAKFRAIALRFFLTDWVRFVRSQPVIVRKLDERGLQARIVYHAHAIEKGLSHTECRFGFGASAISALVQELGIYRDEGYSKDSEAYTCGISVLGEYIDAHSGLGYRPPTVESLPVWLMSEIAGLTHRNGGTVAPMRSPKAGRPGERSFTEVLADRHSIREFGAGAVPEELVRRAVALATRSPSVCNRQAVRVRVVSDKCLARRLTELQGGLGGYPVPPVMLAITADRRDFIDPVERNQPYVDGGLFGMTLLLALEELDLAACPLHAMLHPGIEASVRSLLEVPDHEVLVFFVAVGVRPLAPVVPRSFRYGLDRIIIDVPSRD